MKELMTLTTKQLLQKITHDIDSLDNKLKEVLLYQNLLILIFVRKLDQNQFEEEKLRK